MKVYINKDETPGGSLVCSQISFENPDFTKGMNLAFGVRSDEKIQRLVIDNYGIRAYFEPKEKKWHVDNPKDYLVKEW